MSNAVLPALPGLMFPVVRTPNWSTKVQTSVSGKETRLGYWSYPSWTYSIGYDVLRSNALAELQTLAGFFNARSGSFDSWLFSDPDDYNVVQQSLGTGDGATRSFQLIRVFGGYAEPVKDIVAGTIYVYVNASYTSAYTIDANGLLTFTTAPSAGATITWTGSYYWRCRFLDDHIDLSKFMAQLWELQSLKFKSVK